MKWKDRCIQEANCGHNDGWTMEYYRKELKKIEKKEKIKKVKHNGKINR
jgi:hypothetical protein